MKKLNHPVRKVNGEVIGLDVHKRMIAYCILDRGGREVASGEIGGRPADLEALLDERVGRKRTHVAFEASGHSLWAYDLLVGRYGEERVHVAQSRKIRAIANSQEKNDANDAFWLAYLTLEGRLPEAYIPGAAYRELRIATRERTESVRRRTVLYVRIRAHLAQMGRGLPTVTLRSAKAQAMLARVVAETRGMRGYAIGACVEELDQVDRRIEAWEERIAHLARDLPAVAAIERQLPGAGPALSATIAAESGPLERFATAKSYARTTGLTPGERSSGGRTVMGRISREGSTHLRWALTQAAMACTRARRGPGWAVGEWIRRRQRRTGLKGKVRCAAARKLAESVWRLFHYGECFDAGRAFGARQPVSA